MAVTNAVLSDVDRAVHCLADAFAQDSITGFLLQSDQGYKERLAKFFSLLMRARIALNMPVMVAGETADILGAAMGYATVRPAWPRDLADEWDRFEKDTPGLTDRMATYDAIAAQYKPPVPHYYLGALGVDPRAHGLGIGTQLLKSFCDRSANDRLSCGVYLETTKESNVRFYERAGFVETGRGMLGSSTLWCMYLPHGKRS
jgi:ribosomal protein S18 acetylase RimI-like enzyme